MVPRQLSIVFVMGWFGTAQPTRLTWQVEIWAAEPGMCKNGNNGTYRYIRRHTRFISWFLLGGRHIVLENERKFRSQAEASNRDSIGQSNSICKGIFP